MEDFSFKYVPEAELSKIVKQVQRDRRKKNEEKEWEEYLEKRKLKLQNKNFKEKGIFTGVTDRSVFKNDSIQPEECVKSAITKNDVFASDNHTCNFEEESLSLNLEKVNKLDKLRIFDSPDFNCVGYQHHHQHIGEHSHWYNHEKPHGNVSSELSQSPDKKNCHRNYGDGPCMHSQSMGHHFSNCDHVKVHPSPDNCRKSAPINSHKIADNGDKPKAIIFDGELKARIDNLKTKLIAALNKLLDLSFKGPDVEDDIDIERKMKKTKEFVSRFSRNYLYQLRRQVETIKKLNVNLCSPSTFYHKLFLSYQISLQALQAFQNIVPDKSKLSYDKIVEFLQLFLSALDYFEHNFDDMSNNHEIKMLCSTLIARFKNNNQSQIMDKNLSSNHKNDANESSTNTNVNKYTKKKIIKKQKMSKKLSMYRTSGSNGLPVNWKVTSAGLARKKFGVPNKKISTNLNSKSGITAKKGGDSAVGENVKSKETDDIDDLELLKGSDERTKIFLLFDRLSEMISQSKAEKENLKLKNNEADDEQENKSKITKEEMKNVLQQINELYLHSESLGLTTSSLDCKCPISVSNSSANVKSLPNNNTKQNVSGAKNIGYEDILFDEEEHKKKCQNNVIDHDNHRGNGGHKIPCVQLEISDEQLQSILKYQNDFVNYTNSSPFYEQFNERWSIVKRIGDNLLPKILSDVSQELEINLLVQKMYDLEFTQQT